MNLPFLVFSDHDGRIYNHPFLRMAVGQPHGFSLPKPNELIAMPQGSTFFRMPGRLPVGFNPATKKFEALSEFQGKPVEAVAAFLIPAYLRLHHPAVQVSARQVLPLWAYTACGFYSGGFYAAAMRVDQRLRQSPRFYDNAKICRSVKKYLKQYPDNRLYKHLANCALNYNCLAAKNLFLERWEAPLPTAQTCNARCVGCLSHQDSECASSHSRISFRPTVQEISQVMANHLTAAQEAIVSFGQGCEGEPLLETKNISQAIAQVRKKIRRGTINMNTNASLPENVEALCRAGIDSFRVSLNSVQEKFYDLYFRPRYGFSQVLDSIGIAKKYKKFVSVNLFMFPGFSDSRRETEALFKFLKKYPIDMVQWRNLNIDPDYYQKILPQDKEKPLGISALFFQVKKKFPKLRHGYFNLPFGRG